MGINDFANSSISFEEEPVVRTRVRRSTMASGNQTVRHNESTHMVFKLRTEGMDDYLQVSDDDKVTAGPFTENASCFLVHWFESLDNISGRIIVLESHDGDTLKGDSSGDVSLLGQGKGQAITPKGRTIVLQELRQNTCLYPYMESSNIQNATEADEKFFVLEIDGDAYKIKHFQTGMFLSAEDSDSVSLVSGDNDVTDEMLFHIHPCSATHT